MSAVSREGLPLFKKGKLLEKNIILVHHTITKVNSEKDIQDLSEFSTNLARLAHSQNVRVLTVATPSGKPDLAVKKYCDLYDRILVFVTTQSNFMEAVRKIRGNSCRGRALSGPVQHVTLSDLNSNKLRSVWADIPTLVEKMLS